MQIKEGVVVSLSKQIKKKNKSYCWQAKCELAVVFLVRVVSATLYTVERGFLQNLSTFLGYPCSANQYA